jgi:hypothetical protein
MFKIDRKSAEVKYFNNPGQYTVEIVKAEPGLTSKGDGIVTLSLRSDDGCLATDNFLNKESVYWRVNALLAAVPEVTIPEGSEYDFSKRQVFVDFFSLFIGKRVDIKLEAETYVKDGAEKTILRIKRYIKSSNPF